MSNETYHPRGQLVDGFRVREHPSYPAWANMKSRCRNPDCKSFKDYGARGIGYCERWKHFSNFAEDVGLPPFPGATIDRRNNDEGYSLDNFRWATGTQQCHNRRKFKTNKSGATGVARLRNGTYSARFDSKRVRYNLGRFPTLDDAKKYRAEFVSIFHDDPDRAASMCERRARLDSTSGIRGITTSPSGFIVRKTVCGERLYLGHATSLAGAVRLLQGMGDV